ncbi:MAG: glutamate-cysteine ligase family protein [Methanomicrobiales archaeon]|nr:glutamate-cysteine ligase family protein [Methanomicrobiales archaeon]
MPVSDRVLEKISGRIQNETPLGDVIVSKELQKHVIEIVPRRPSTSLAELEKTVQSGIDHLYNFLDPDLRLLGLGMHPLLTLDMTGVWDHEEGEVYEEYDRLFNIRQHGWLNIQALQINLPYSSEEELIRLHNRIRTLIPYLVAVSAASPFVEGKKTTTMDNRIIFYRKNQEKIPLICNDLIPEKLTRLAEYHTMQECICRSLEKEGAQILCREWVNSRGVIVRFSRNCLEIKAIDEQECVRSDMAITAFVLALIRSDTLSLDEDQDQILDLTEEAIFRGVETLRPELRRLYAVAEKTATPDELRYLPLVKKKIEKGSLAEVLSRKAAGMTNLYPVLRDLEYCLRHNMPYV